MEAVYPTGRAAPRHISLAARRPRNNRRNIPSRHLRHDPYDSEGDEHESDYDDEQKDAVLHAEPSSTINQYIQFQNRTITFQVKDDGLSSFSLPMNQKKWLVTSTFLGTHDIFTSLIQTARREYLASLPKRAISIYSPEHGSWYKKSTRTMRPWDSIILPDGIKEWLLDDASEFLAEKDFYAERGVPHRRGYLLYGEPGSGKSSLISALAARLKLDIYIVNIGGRYLDDDTLMNLMQDCPSRCILLMEDIDCAFKKRNLPSARARHTTHHDDSVSSSTDKDQEGEDAKKEREETEYRPERDDMFQNSGPTITLSGLLNALDRVASSEGRLLFCTTNWKDKIDPALCRPGRCDVWIEFKHATHVQARDLFVHFYRSRSNPTTSIDIIKNNQSILSTKHEDDAELLALGERFASAIPQDTVSASALQGYLIRFKRDPHAAVEVVRHWVESGCGQGPTISIKDGKVQERVVDEGGSSSSEETMNGVLDNKEDTHGSPRDGFGGKGILPNGDRKVGYIPNGWGNGNATNHGNGNIIRRARTHFRSLSRGK
ncbi:hypothetical protein I302_107283 [Kwoniella bestiolae CBS 10118]|uniref:AAA+ ATPase domain-containing protein n=1 Tax=Kwoniella bestiolae CBS 10118 TaxID=1296100 RepID=A0A1B9FZ05_9TREE|nr:hypothetical protein I302_06981 [Kwoniella bestiolae CBS 10118]OCF23995.1 hypothetical protein I302_06981 [Kwoniella bestiolae CBS 10118]